MLISQNLKIVRPTFGRSLTAWRRAARALVVASGLAGLAVAWALPAGADSIVQGYKSDQNLAIGTIVALDKADNSKVVPAPAKEPARVYGVVIDPRAAVVSLSQAGQNVYVATGGTGAYPVIASDEAGPIKTGDYLSLSNIDGIAAKATATETYGLGRALSAFDGKSGVLATTNTGHHLGLVSLSLTIGKNPLSSSLKVPGPLRTAGEAIAGKTVSPTRLYLALLIFMVAIIAGVSLLYSSIRAALTALGRNPLNRQSIFRGLYQAIGLGVMIFGLGLFGVYLLLKL